MATKPFSRRKLLQSASLLLAGAAISPAALAQQDGPKTVFIPPGGGRKGKISKSDISFKLNKSQTSGHLGSAEMVIPAGQLGAPPHYHKTFDEICIVLEGTLNIMVEDEVFQVKAGGWHLRPRGKTHAFWNSGPKPARVIEMYTPGGHEEYMLELSKLFDNGGRPAPTDVQKLAAKHDTYFQMDKLEGIMKKYKVTL